MNFVEGEFDSLPVNTEVYKDNYETGTSLIPRKIILLHIIKYLIYVKRQMNIHSEQS